MTEALQIGQKHSRRLFCYFWKRTKGTFSVQAPLQCRKNTEHSPFFSNFCHVCLLLSSRRICSMPSTPPLILPSPLTPALMTLRLWPAPSPDPLPASDFLLLHGKTQGNVKTFKQTLAWHQRKQNCVEIPTPREARFLKNNGHLRISSAGRGGLVIKSASVNTS